MGTAKRNTFFMIGPCVISIFFEPRIIRLLSSEKKLRERFLPSFNILPFPLSVKNFAPFQTAIPSFFFKRLLAITPMFDIIESELPTKRNIF